MDIDTSKKIVVVEDNESLRRLLISIIRKIGFKEIREAGNGEEAWEYIQRNDIDLVLTDWDMPRMNGLELLKKIRGADDEINGIPVLMITVMDKKENILEAAKLNVNGYILKPFNMKIISEKIQEVL